MRNLYITTYLTYAQPESVAHYHFDETSEVFYTLTSDKQLNVFSLKGKSLEVFLIFR